MKNIIIIFKYWLFLISLLVYLVLVSILASLNLLPYKVVSIISFIVICLLFL